MEKTLAERVVTIVSGIRGHRDCFVRIMSRKVKSHSRRMANASQTNLSTFMRHKRHLIEIFYLSRSHQPTTQPLNHPTTWPSKQLTTR